MHQFDDDDEAILKAHKKHSIYDLGHLHVKLKDIPETPDTKSRTGEENEDKSKANTGYLETDLWCVLTLLDLIRPKL